MTDKIETDDIAASRRKFLTGAAVAGAGALSVALLPQWINPVAEFVATPANAAEGFYLADIFRRSHTAPESSPGTDDGPTAEGDETPDVSTTTSTSTTGEGSSTSSTASPTSTTTEATTTTTEATTTTVAPTTTQET